MTRLSRPTAACGILLGLAVLGAASSAAPPQAQTGALAEARSRLPNNQVLTPSGIQVDLPGLRPQVLALSPDGRFLVTSGKTHELVVLDASSGRIVQNVPLPAEPLEPRPAAASPNILKPDDKGQVSYTGLVFSPDGRRLYLSNVDGSIKVFTIAPDGRVSPLISFALPRAGAPRRAEEIPAGLAHSPDGRKLYAALNLSNRLGEFDASTGELLRAFEVGVAPYDVVLVKDKAYVSNWGGRRPQAGDVAGPAGRGTTVRVDPRTRIANEGSISVVDLRRSRILAEIVTPPHASALALHPGGRYLACANAAADNISVIDTRTDGIVETIWAKPDPADLFGASPNALAFDPKGGLLFSANGTQNAVAAIRFDPRRRASAFLGLIPVGWWPGAVVFDARRNRLCVANIKGLPEAKELDKATGGLGFNSHQYYGSLSLVPVPPLERLPALSAAVWRNFHRERIGEALRPPRPNQPPRAVPERIGEPSPIKHVVYIIKENRTYDQILGDVRAGNGDPSLCLFGERVTPNQHKMVSEFVLLDNTHCCSVLSADGHQWSTTAFATDYLEKSFAGWPRSYPDGMGEDEIDALAYAPSGFLWDNALKHGKILRDYGEFAISTTRWADPKRAGEPDWTDCWREYTTGGGEVVFGCRPAIETLAPHLAAQTVGWDMKVPDQYRARTFIAELKEYERKGTFPDLVLICLPDDHTSGTQEGSPTPEACAADNDLAFGRIVEALSLSPFWKNMVIFAVEDDPQNGWDHVSGFRTTAYLIGPYVKRGAVVSSFTNTVSLLRTMEQILGLPPMNQFDAAAAPMADAFTDQPDFTPFRAVPNIIPLDRMNPPPAKIKDPKLRSDALASARLNFRRVDACPEDVFNRILWRAVKGSAAPYPEWAVRARPGAEDDD